MKLGSQRQREFSAAVTPAGVYVVAYRRSANGLEITSYNHILRPLTDAASASDALATLIEAEGGRGGRVSVALSGLGSHHQTLTLPAAPRGVLLPVVTRELKRSFPALFADEPGHVIVDYVAVGGVSHDPDGTQREILAAALRRAVLDVFVRSLQSRGIELERLTILPRAMQGAYSALEGSPEPTAVLALAPGVPLLGFFVEGQLRLFSESPAGLSAWKPGAAGDPSAVIEQIERGALYLRQQFRGVRVSQVVMAVEGGGGSAVLNEQITAALEIPVRPLGPYAHEPGAVIAAGAALEAQLPHTLDLLPADLRPPSEQERLSHRLGVASLAVIVAAAAWWSISGIRAEAAAEKTLEQVHAKLDSREVEYNEIREVVDSRQAHTQRAALLAAIVGGRERLPAVLWPFEAAPPAVSIQALTLEPSEAGWDGYVTGISRGNTSAQATAAVNNLFRSLSRELPDGSVSIDAISYGGSGGGENSSAENAEFAAPIALSFTISFIVPAVEEGSS